MSLAVLGFGPFADARTCTPVAAELISAQGLVEYRVDDAWYTATPGEALCDRDAIRTGGNSRAAIRLVDDAVLRLDENTTLVLADVAPEPETPSLLQLVFGAIQSFSRDPQTLKVDTPYINATIEGTEFALRVTDTDGILTVVEGDVLAANALGSVRVSSGGGAVATADTAPRSVIVARPRDAVTWGLYYPPALSLTGADTPALSEAMQLAGANRADAAIATLRAAVPSTRSRLYEAALLLSVGQSDEAARILDAVLADEPGNGEALAQSAVIDVAQNNRDAALAKAERAVAAAPNAAAPYVALSLAQQSNFQLDAARDTLVKGTQAVPNSALLWARLSEIWLTLGYRDRSGEAADKALSIDPNLERAHVMKGFAALTEYRTEAAKAAFAHAISLDQADPLPHLGIGLALIREGDLEPGRGEIDAAVALDSNQSLLRSYLGKAYFQEARNQLAVEQFKIAKELDPNDPTPYLYDAIRLQTENRPGEALAAIQDSIERNDNRAVYRGRLQLDQDQAARGASLGRIYEDLGFILLGVREATRSQSLDPSNAAAHRFLADIYRNERRREIARVSELTRAQLLQDINLNPVQPSLTETNLNLISAGGPANAGFNEFNSLFASDGIRFTATGVVGNDSTYGGEAAFAAQKDNFSVSFGGLEFTSDGFRPNFDARHTIYDLFAQWAVTPELNLQAEIRHRETRIGDLNLNPNSDAFLPDLRRGIEENSARIGLRYSPDPHNDTLFSLVYADRDLFESNIIPDTPFGPVQSFFPNIGDGWQAEAQHIYQRGPVSITVGGSYTDFDDKMGADFTIVGEPDPFFSFPLDDINFSAWRLYFYGTLDLPLPESLGDVTLTLGGSYDSFEEKDATFAASNKVDQFNPKAGVEWAVTDDLTLRAGYSEVVKPPLVTNRTIEPTDVAGFNQYFDDPNGTPSRRYGFGADYRVSDKLFVGAEATWRKLDVPFFFFDGAGAGQVDSAEWRERTHRAYIYALPHPRVPVSLEFVYDWFDADPSPYTDLTDIETFSVPATVRYFDPSGFFAGVRGTYVHQKVRRFDPSLGDGKSDFFNIDAMAGYRFPKQRGSLTLEVQNLLDNDLRYQDDGFREFSNAGATGPFFPSLGIMGRLTINF